ncbi:type II CRISPR RNA-guided endonuclease Cas9 [Bifidobacterium simiarum]|uniref:type II CRISPR RNA-guided endonuclease Cas9 n=1 Tax=Bifidobacterium simiarum TaxID=2045441 RepID=UPI001BDC55F9|nr:type II CRISPR RNA-guided endonuclease Cas9 [Bifidobacterium simiarum]MBT1165445.1 HNH endonuclease [Bifidobacterium simiarum]
MTKRPYKLGIDVGLNSVGLASIEVDNEGAPIRILNMQSVIHDGGVDPEKNKEAITRKAMSGVGRRVRRMRRRRRARLQRVDLALEQAGYPIIEPESLTLPFEEWQVRSDLATHYIEDDEIRREDISIAVRHIARHRGWRNSYKRVDSLLPDVPYSKQYEELLDRAEEKLGKTLPQELTPAQIVHAVLANGFTEAPRLRTKVNTAEKVSVQGLLPVRMMQEDNANELKRIFEVQRVPKEEWLPIFREVFHVVSPKGSAESRVGRDPLDPSQPRALKASLTFQRYRIINVVTNLRIFENGMERPLTVDERQMVFDNLCTPSSDDITWSDVAELLGLKRSQIRGVGKLTEDGEERIATRPPRLTSIQRIYAAEPKIRKPLLRWWNDASEGSQEAMIRLLTNTVDVDRVRDDLDYAEAIEFIDTLDDDGLTRLDSIDLPAGRAAYSVSTLTKLTERMLTAEDDLHEARKSMFDVSDNWRPPSDPIDAPLGNPAVDRVLKIVNRYLINCQRRWGDPVTVQIEHVRNSLGSVASARKAQREYERINERRFASRQELERKLREDESQDSVRNSDIRRLEAVQRQNGQCLYCGSPITFRTCEMDHIVPRKGAGSTNTRTNLAAVCAECNRMKSNIPFAVWARTSAARDREVSLSGAKKRVDAFLADSGASPREQRAFHQAVKARLEQTEQDDPIDNRSVESVAWMADELHRRIDWYFNAERYRNDAPEDSYASVPTTKVWVFQGKVTALARKASGIEGKIHFIGAKTKTRLDRRHHAVDAAVIAMMNHAVARTLMERDSMRESQHLIRNASDEWKKYPTPNDGDGKYASYQRWLSSMNRLLDLMNEALDEDRVPVSQWRRYSLGNSIVHDATIHKLVKLRLCEAMDADLIRRASTPALYCALTRLPDYSPVKGLPADESRSITVNGQRVSAQETVGFFASKAAQIAVQGGSADIGSTIHHARVYRCWKANARGVRKYFYGMIRVFQTDLRYSRHDDLFSVALPPQSISMRYGEPRTVQAVQEGRAEYLGYLIVGDEIELDLSAAPLSGQIGEFMQFFDGMNDEGRNACRRWVVDGFYSPSKLRLRPRMLASEGLKKLTEFGNIEIPDGVDKIINRQGWFPAIGVIDRYRPRIIRRNAFGEPRWTSSSGLPVSWSWPE